MAVLSFLTQVKLPLFQANHLSYSMPHRKMSDRSS